MTGITCLATGKEAPVPLPTVLPNLLNRELSVSEDDCSGDQKTFAVGRQSRGGPAADLNLTVLGRRQRALQATGAGAQPGRPAATEG